MPSGPISYLDATVDASLIYTRHTILEALQAAKSAERSTPSPLELSSRTAITALPTDAAKASTVFYNSPAV